MEHRHHERFPINVSATVHTPQGEWYAASIGNPGCGGAFLASLNEAQRRVHRWV